MRSKLFVPASRPELFPKALASAADALSFDLEDAVLPAKKADAREALSDFLNGELLTAARRHDKHQTIIVRINPLGSEHFDADLRVACHRNVDIINLPKTESADDVGVSQNCLTAQNTPPAAPRVWPTSAYSPISRHRRRWQMPPPSPVHTRTVGPPTGAGRSIRTAEHRALR